ncbi:MAG: pentapeptide repeat-containing protein [Elainellaceae cyanobacterium]
MSDSHFFDLIQRGVDLWNQWREAHPHAKPDLSRCYLFEADLRGANLQNAIFNRTCLIGADLTHADLTGADLTGAYASDACFAAANLERATLTGANLSASNLTTAKLVSVKADGTDFSAACLTGACLENWSISLATRFERVDCTYVYLRQHKQSRYPQHGTFKPDEFATLVREQPDLSMWATVQSADESLDEVGNEAHANAPNIQFNQAADTDIRPDITPDDLAIAVPDISAPVHEPATPPPTATNAESDGDQTPPARSLPDPWLNGARDNDSELPTQMAPPQPASLQLEPVEPAVSTLSASQSWRSSANRLHRDYSPLSPATPNWRLSKGIVIAAMILGAGAIASVAVIGWRTTIRSPQSAPAADLVNLPCNEPLLPNVSAQTPDYTYDNGTKFYGEFAGNAPADGRGTMIFANGDRYDGEYQDGRRNGCGTFTFDNGRQYVGQFENDQFEGLGIWTLETGDRYVGEFQNNKCHGEGTFQFTDGSSETGTWHNGSLVNGDLSCGRGAAHLSDSPS